MNFNFLNDFLCSTPNDPRAEAIEVIPRAIYVPQHSDPASHRFAFGYEIRIINHGLQTVQLINRHWRIDMGNGCIQEVRGDGIVGEQPKIAPNAEHRYQSGSVIESPAGRMWGDYGFVDEQGDAFKVAIPMFHLIAPSDYRPIH
ncbi:MAG TPA: Co2+/Mg2+ efflux protein ApaG [Halothiobacillus sp.]|nr:Co2+/Mg2+ efflux protein ApaG [Halothiobacillus sp.]